jgi:hypothetical protein
LLLLTLGGDVACRPKDRFFHGIAPRRTQTKHCAWGEFKDVSIDGMGGQNRVVSHQEMERVPIYFTLKRWMSSKSAQLGCE